MTGISSAGIARQVIPGSSRSGTFSSTGNRRRLAVNAISAICTAPSRSPGTTPARNR
jgi:hypothetical protein